MDLKKEAFKMDLAKIALDCQTLNNETKIRAEKQKAELALEHLHAKMASAQEKKTQMPPTRQRKSRISMTISRKGNSLQHFLGLTW